MGQKRYYEFERFSLGKLEFFPHSFSQGIRYDASLIPEISENNENNVRLTMNLKLISVDNDCCIFDIEDTAYFVVSDEFGDFNIENEEIKEMVDIVIDDVKKLIYDISNKAFEQPISFDISAQNFVDKMKNSND